MKASLPKVKQTKKAADIVLQNNAAEEIKTSCEPIDYFAQICTDYVHEQQERYLTQLQMAKDVVQTAASSEQVKLNK